MNSFPRAILCGLIRLYQWGLSPALSAVFGPFGFGCRFTPTCSAYMLLAVQQHGALKGTGLGLRRLCRCQPWGGAGDDPVPASPHCGKKTAIQ